MDYEKLCSQILKTDPKIRFAAVYDFWAERIAGGMKEGLDSHLAEKITMNSVNQALLRWKSRKTTALTAWARRAPMCYPRLHCWA